MKTRNQERQKAGSSTNFYCGQKIKCAHKFLEACKRYCNLVMWFQTVKPEGFSYGS